MTNRHHETLIDGLYQQYKDGILTDVTLVVEDVKIECHRNVLAASSPYFRAMFTNPLAERKQQEIAIRDVTSHTMMDLVEFMYTGVIQVTNENVQDTFMTSTLLEMLTLVDLCTDHMITELNADNCVAVYKFASQFVSTNLRAQAKTCILEHFEETLKDGSILTVDIDDFKDLVSNDEISVDKESIIFEAIISWTEYEKGRKQHLSGLFKEVRLPLVDEDYFQNIILCNSSITNDPGCKEILSVFHLYKVCQGDASTADKMSSAELSTNFDVNAKPRLGMYTRSMIIFSGGADGRSNRSFTAFDPVSRNNYLSIIPHPSFDFKFRIDFYRIIVTEDNEIFFLGGIFYDDYHFTNSAEALKDVLRYNIKLMTWKKVAPMSTPRCCFSVCCQRNTIFVLGGKRYFPLGEPLDSFECYDCENDLWLNLSSAPIVMYNHSACVCQDAIFALGGITEDDQYLDTVLHYNIRRDSWTLVRTEMMRPRADFAAHVHDDRIFVVGGASKHENCLKVEIYDPSRNKWIFGEDFPEERKSVASTIIGDNIYLSGGVRKMGLRGRRSRQVESRDLYRYNIPANKWSLEAKVVQYGNMHACSNALLNTKFLQLSDFISGQ